MTARVAPGAGAALVSLAIAGREWLHLPEPLRRFLQGERTGGVPLLFPWANRLRTDRFRVLGRSIDLSHVAGVHRDSAGLPMHGLLLRWGRWELDRAANGDAFAARLHWSGRGTTRELYRAFPFDLELEVRYRLIDAPGLSLGVEVETVVDALTAPVPLSFGWHPYLRLPGAREHCVMCAPPLLQIPLTGGLPTVGGTPGPSDLLQPPSSVWTTAGADELHSGVRDGQRVLVEAISPSSPARSARRIVRRRSVPRCEVESIGIQVEFVRGYRFMQIYSPPGASFICIEPMMAPTAALSDSSVQLPVIQPGTRSSAIFRIGVQGFTPGGSGDE
ncbi:MAG: aldose 1-epimerase [Phycisphaeraceae bacterium]|nr:aldose 1-epimerase [Phycisphaeraceae bacterium]